MHVCELGFVNGIAYSTVNMKDHRALGTFKTEANLDDAFFVLLLLLLVDLALPKVTQVLVTL
jgi:hypothetical protein